MAVTVSVGNHHYLHHLSYPFLYLCFPLVFHYSPLVYYPAAQKEQDMVAGHKMGICHNVAWHVEKVPDLLLPSCLHFVLCSFHHQLQIPKLEQCHPICPNKQGSVHHHDQMHPHQKKVRAADADYQQEIYGSSSCDPAASSCHQA